LCVPLLLAAGLPPAAPALPGGAGAAEPPYAGATLLQRRVGSDPADVIVPIRPLQGERGGPLPVALLLQGANVGRQNYRSFARELARHGFVVVVPDHRRRFPPLPLLGRPMLLSEPRQVSDLQAALSVWNREGGASPLAGRLASGRLVVIGHSMGGLAAINALRDVCRWPLCRGPFRRPAALRGGVAYGTGLRGHFGGAIPEVDTGGRPLALLRGSRDGLTPPAEIGATYRRLRAMPRALITIEGANHYGITDTSEPPAVGGLGAPKPDPNPPAPPQAESIAAIARWSALFLRAYVLAESSARRRLEAEARGAGARLEAQDH
jgi:predicted dienelactone hydrolase